MGRNAFPPYLANPNYTDIVGQDMGIIGILSSVQYLTSEFTASVEQGGDRESGTFRFYETWS